MPMPYLPGAEPPGAVAAMMLEAGAVIELTSLFIGSSRARRNATERGVRYLAMPGVRLETFRAGGPLDVDFEQLRADAERVGKAWGAARRFRLTTPGGTDLRGSVADRPGRVLHGIATQPGAYMAPPDIESGTAPVEGTASGTVVVDGDLLFMGQGPLPEPVVLHVADGQVRGIEGAERTRLTSMLERCISFTLPSTHSCQRLPKDPADQVTRPSARLAQPIRALETSRRARSAQASPARKGAAVMARYAVGAESAGSAAMM